MIEGISQELQYGKAGEHLTCFDLIMKKYNAFLADAGLPYDVVVDINGKLLRVQVKSCQKPTIVGKCRHIYPFRLRFGKNDKSPTNILRFDYVAFAFLDIKSVQYLPAKYLVSDNGYHLKQCIHFYNSGNAGHNTSHKYVIGKFDMLEEKPY